MNKIMRKLKKLIYEIGLFLLFISLITQFFDCFNHKMDGDNIFMLVVICIVFYSICIMINKIIKSTDFLISIRKIIYSKNLDNKTKINHLNMEMFNIDAYLNEYK